MNKEANKQTNKSNHISKDSIFCLFYTTDG